MMRWYRSLIPGRMPLWLAAFVALFGVSTLLLWIATTIGSGIVIRLQTGDTIRFEQVRQSADSTVAHFFTVESSGFDAEELGIDFNLDDGRFGSDPPGGPLDGYEITFTAAGQYIITDSAHPRGHGSAKFVVADSDGGGGRLIVTGAFIVEDARFVLAIPETNAQFGYAAGSRVVSRSTADQLIFLSLLGGSVFAAPVIALVKRRRWWMWGLFGLVGGFLGIGQPFLTSVTVVATVLLSERPRPALEEVEPEEPEDGEAEGPPEDLPEPGPPTQDQRTLPPPVPAAPPRPRPERSRRRPRY